MNLAELLTTERQQRKCAYANLLDQLADDEKEALQFALRNPAKPIRQIYEILQNAGYVIGRDTLAQHRKGQCANCTSA